MGVTDYFQTITAMMDMSLFPATTLEEEEEVLLQSWFLLATPWPVIVILLGYLSFVLKIGPSLMASRKPYKLKTIMLVYNMFQVLFNGYLVLWFFLHPVAIPYLMKHSCHPMDARGNLYRMEFHLASWCYMLAKIFDMIDTIFLVLRKKDSHVSFLHLYHHTSMVAFSWLSVKYLHAEHGVSLGVMNAFVHVIMYSYYFLAGLGPKFQRYLWWKKYLTKLQIAQFAVAIIFLLNLYYHKCPVPQLYNVIWIVNITVITAFFINFYVQTYIINKSSHEPKKKLW